MAVLPCPKLDAAVPPILAAARL